MVSAAGAAIMANVALVKEFIDENLETTLSAFFVGNVGIVRCLLVTAAFNPQVLEAFGFLTSVEPSDTPKGFVEVIKRIFIPVR